MNGGEQQERDLSTKPPMDMAEDFDVDQMSHLKSERTWEEIGVPKPLAERLIQLGFKNPSKIQEQVVPAAMHSSVFAQSQNGSGKTLSFLIPAVLYSNPQISCTNERGLPAPQVLIFADTRALITQLEKLASKVAACSPGLKVGYSFSGQDEESTEAGHIFISTAKRISNLVAKQKFSFEHLQLVILDEADMVMQSDSQEKFIGKLIISMLPKQLRVILTSATVTPLTQMLVEKTQHKNYRTIEVKREELTLKNVQQFYIRCTHAQILDCLDSLLAKITSSNILIFMNTRKLMGEVQTHLTGNGHRVISVSSNQIQDRTQEAKLNQYSIESFMKGEYRILLTTNLLSRGIDMRKVNFVINMELPVSYPATSEDSQRAVPSGPDFETYLHRVGRTGRYGDQGIALNMITNEYAMGYLKEIIEYYQIQMHEIKADSLQSLNTVLDGVDKYNKDKREQLEENI